MAAVCHMSAVSPTRVDLMQNFRKLSSVNMSGSPTVNPKGTADNVEQWVITNRMEVVSGTFVSHTYL